MSVSSRTPCKKLPSACRGSPRTQRSLRAASRPCAGCPPKQSAHHLACRNEVVVIIGDGLQLAYVRDAADRRSPGLPDALGKDIHRPGDGSGLLVEEQMVVPEVRTRQVPVIVLGLTRELFARLVRRSGSGTDAAPQARTVVIDGVSSHEAEICSRSAARGGTRSRLLCATVCAPVDH